MACTDVARVKAKAIAISLIIFFSSSTLQSVDPHWRPTSRRLKSDASCAFACREGIPALATSSARRGRYRIFDVAHVKPTPVGSRAEDTQPFSAKPERGLMPQYGS